MSYTTTKGICFGIFYKFQSSWVSRFQLGKVTSGSASELHKLPTFLLSQIGQRPAYAELAEFSTKAWNRRGLFRLEMVRTSIFKHLSAYIV